MRAVAGGVIPLAINDTPSYINYSEIMKKWYALSLFVLLSILPVVSAQMHGGGISHGHSEGHFYMETEQVDILMTSHHEAPHFQWWDANQTLHGTKYHLSFHSLFEVEDGNGDGIYTPEEDVIIGSRYTIPSEGWETSEFRTVKDNDITTEVHFNFTHKGAVYIQLRMHMYLSYQHQMKYDVIISNWTWNQSDSLLVLGMSLSSSEMHHHFGQHAPLEFTKNENDFNFRNGFMQNAVEANILNNSIERISSLCSYGNSSGAGIALYTAFENFGNNTLVYDPIIGIERDVTLNQWIIPVIGIGIIVTIMALVMVTILKRLNNKRN
ncbi:MAG: hypothetical protein BAJATHORv1_10517 [Candidatus Thorarchaeota archaeon]|nr:MAG: hypothetical protein BAJATHORv1_10517 [Candidatus Thorarchaeota archaeon]